MAFTVIQYAEASASVSAGGAHIDATFPAPVTAGNLLLAIYGGGGGNGCLIGTTFAADGSVSEDSFGTPIVLVYDWIAIPGSYANVQIWGCLAAGSGLNTITLSLDSEPSTVYFQFPPWPVTLHILEIAGPEVPTDIDSLFGIDVSSSVRTGFTSNPTLGFDVSTALADRLCISACVATNDGVLSYVVRTVTGPGNYSDTMADVGQTAGTLSGPGTPLPVRSATLILGVQGGSSGPVYAARYYGK